MTASILLSIVVRKNSCSLVEVDDKGAECQLLVRRQPVRLSFHFWGRWRHFPLSQIYLGKARP